MSNQDLQLLDLFQEALGAVLHDFQIFRAQRSFTNEIIGFEIIFQTDTDSLQNDLALLSDYRLIYTLKKVLGANHQGQWTSLEDRMLLPLTHDDVLVLPFDAHRHQPLPEQISMVLGFDGVSHVIKESIAKRLINRALENLIAHHKPFAFGVLNIDSYSDVLSKLATNNHHQISHHFRSAFQVKLHRDDVIAALDENEFAIVLDCQRDITEVFPKLLELATLSNTPLAIDGHEITVQFSAGYVLVTDPFTTVEEILEEAFLMMYKSKNDGKNGYSLSNSHHD